MEATMKSGFVLTLGGVKVRFSFHCMHISADMKALEGLLGYMQSGKNKNCFIPVSIDEALEIGWPSFQCKATSLERVFRVCEDHEVNGTDLPIGMKRKCALLKTYRMKSAADLGVLSSALPCPGRRGRLSALSVFLCKSVLCGAFLWARRALTHQKRQFPAD
jgi:hypothetical protein